MGTLLHQRKNKQAPDNKNENLSSVVSQSLQCLGKGFSLLMYVCSAWHMDALIPSLERLGITTVQITNKSCQRMI